MSKRIGFGLPLPAADRRENGWGRQLGLVEMISADAQEGRGRVVVVGWLILDRSDLLRLKDRGLEVDVRVVGRLRLVDDISPKLAEEVLRSVRVTGSVGVSEPVRQRLGDRLA